MSPCTVPFFSDGLSQLRKAKLPLRFSVGEDPIEHTGETIGISADHFMMTSPIELQVGSRLLVKILVPFEVSGSPFTELPVSGRIVCGSRLTQALYGYQVQIERG